MSRTGKIKDKMLHGSGIFMFLRSSAAAQIASWVDLGLGFVLFSWCGLSSWLATGIGAVVGGCINCCINYRFTFHAKGVGVHAVAVKYLLVWTGSLLLNTYGTAGLYDLMRSLPLFDNLGFTEKGCYAVARVSVSLIVSILWNFLLQRYFVYRQVRFDRVLDRLFRVKSGENHQPRKKTTQL